jgi:hypothetical protein
MSTALLIVAALLVALGFFAILLIACSMNIEKIDDDIFPEEFPDERTDPAPF